MSKSNTVKVTAEAEAILVKVLGESIDEEAAQQLEKQAMTAANGSPGLPLIVDLSEVGMVPSLAIGTLMAMWRQFGQTKRRFILAGLQPAVREMLATCRLDQLLEMAETVEQARMLASRPAGS